MDHANAHANAQADADILVLPPSLRDMGIHAITMPMPFALRHVHAYLLETDDGWILVDAGFPSQEALALFEPALRRVVGSLDRIQAIVVSHFHPDHTGLAGWIQQRSGAPVYMHALDGERRQQMQARDPDLVEGRGSLFQQDLGGGDKVFDLFRREIEAIELPELRPTLVEDDTDLTVGGRALRLVWTPGHSPGHLCVLDVAGNVLFSGDHILGRITPHVGLWTADGTSPLHEFEDSLRKVDAMHVDTVLPAHESLVERPAERIGEILAHHVQRKAETVAAVASGDGKVQGVAAQIFAKRWDQPMQRAFAMAETLAHLEALVRDGALTRNGLGVDAVYRVE